MPPSAPLMLSVSGARGLVGQTMTPEVAADFAAAFGSFVKSSTGTANPLLCIGRDGRPSGAELMSAAINGLLSTGCRVIDLGIVTTPTVAVMIGKHRAAAGGAVGGMEITASHNPIIWNGLKCLNADGVAPPPSDAHEIIRRFRDKDFVRAPADRASAYQRNETGSRTHVDRVLVNIGAPDVEAIRAAKLKVVLDSINGAGCVPGRMLLEALNCEVVHINGEPTGQFAHTPEPTEENLLDLAGRTAKEKAVCGFAQDPDADRLAIIDERGGYIGEEYTLVLAAKRVLAQRSAISGQRSAVLATNLSTSRMIDDVAAQFGASVLRTAVGEANVVAAMKPHGSNAILGGEGNGGVILPSVCWVRDSLSAMALTLSLIVAEKKSLSAVVAGLPKYHMIKHKFDLAKIGGLAVVKPALEKVQQRFADARISTLDGVRLDFDDGWVHLRPSNTEPIVRLIAEAKTESRTLGLVDEVAVAAGLK